MHTEHVIWIIAALTVLCAALAVDVVVFAITGQSMFGVHERWLS